MTQQSERNGGNARVVGRGMLFITGAKFYFIGTATLLTYALTLLFDKETFGRYSVVLGVLNIANMVVVQGTLQTVSKHISEAEGIAGAVRRAAYRLQGMVALIVIIAGILGAPLWAAILGDASLSTALRIGFLTTAAYAFYAMYIGEFNGRKRFGLQASMDVSFATIKLVLMVGLAALGFGVIGAIAGFSATAITMMVVAFLVLRRIGAENNAIEEKDFAAAVSPVALLKFEALIIASAAVLNLLLQQDLLLMKALLSRTADLSFADKSAGVYSTALLLSRLTYQATIAVTFVILPLLSRSTFEQDREKTSLYVRTTMKYSLIIVSFISGCIIALAPQVYEVLLPAYTEGAGPAAVLAIAYGLFSLLLILTTMITASGRPGMSLLALGAALIAAAGANVILIPRYDLWGAAVGTLFGMTTGFVFSGLLVRRFFQSFMSLFEALRTTIPVALVVGGLVLWPVSGLMMIIVKALVTVLALAGALVVSGAVRKQELLDVRRALKG